MRGGLDDALQKLARRNELRRRAAAQPAPISPPAVTDLVEAVASVVARHPHLRVALGVEGVGAPAALRVWAHDGVPHVSIEAVATAPYDGVAPAVTDPDPAPPEVPAGSPNRPAGVQFAADPTSAGWGARSGSDLKAGETAPDTAPAAAPMAAGHPKAHPGPGDHRPDSGAGDHRSDPGPGDLRPGVGPSDPRLDPGVRPDPGLRGPGTGGSGFPGAPVPEREPMPTRDQARGIDQETTVPLRRPAEPLAVPSSEQAAKRLAAMLRANPSLLHNTPPD